MKQLTFKKTSGWGGRRNGAGRPNRSQTVNHMKRPKVNIQKPLHITMRLKEGLPTIRSKNLVKEFKRGLKKAREQGLYVIHYSIQGNHIHLIAETKSNEALALGMRSLVGRFAKILRSRAYENFNGRRRGSVFKGRYHLHVLKTPTEMKNALEYVLLNYSKHLESIEYLDPFSSAKYFSKWKTLLGKRFTSVIRFEVEAIDQEEIQNFDLLSPPKSWLCKTGWERAVG